MKTNGTFFFTDRHIQRLAERLEEGSTSWVRTSESSLSQTERGRQRRRRQTCFGAGEPGSRQHFPTSSAVKQARRCTQSHRCRQHRWFNFSTLLSCKNICLLFWSDKIIIELFSALNQDVRISAKLVQNPDKCETKIRFNSGPVFVKSIMFGHVLLMH